MPVVVDLAPLIAMAVITAAILVLAIYKITLGALVQGAIHLLEGARIHVRFVSVNPFDPIISALKVIDNAAYATLGTLIKTDRIVWSHFVHWNAYIWAEATGALGDVSHETGKALHILRRLTIPGLLGASLAPLLRRLGYVEAKLNTLEHEATSTITHVTKVVESKITEVKPTTVIRLTKVIEAKAVALPQAIPNPWPRIREVEHDATQAWKRVKSIGKTLTPAGIIGLVGATIIGPMGLNWLRCRGVNRVGRGLCGLSGLIEEIALGAISSFIVADLCTIMTLSLKAAEEAKPALNDIFNLVDGLARCQGITANPKLTVAGVRLNPPMTPLTL